ncbi:MAG TPA: SAM-dependent chlorinase/fluorinase [Desulfosalsimonadaceae bacterium]|nr:SAM-dependent chlorinase/fluorinase [Desulfosalsimonadaceae bacterium]
MPVIALLTDFGLSDPYVGIMKGVILFICPQASIVDVSHDVAPQDIREAAYLLDAAYPYFPEKTVHTVVVDPGVGTGRAIVAVQNAGHYFLAPDNGVLTKVLAGRELQAAVRVENPAYFIQPVSRTFHGRDIFAPVAAHMAEGKSLDAFGPRISAEDMVQLELPAAYLSEKGEVAGAVITADRFGNMITNIPENLVQQLAPGTDESRLQVQVGAYEIKGLSASYQAVFPGELLAIIGSRGYLEISVNQGDARAFCGVGKDARVVVKVQGLRCRV